MKLTIRCREVLTRSVPVKEGVERIFSAATFDSGNRASKDAEGKDVVVTPAFTAKWDTLEGTPFTTGLEYEVEIVEVKPKEETK